MRRVGSEVVIVRKITHESGLNADYLLGLHLQITEKSADRNAIA